MWQVEDTDNFVRFPIVSVFTIVKYYRFNLTRNDQSPFSCYLSVSRRENKSASPSILTKILFDDRLGDKASNNAKYVFAPDRAGTALSLSPAKALIGFNFSIALSKGHHANSLAIRKVNCTTFLYVDDFFVSIFFYARILKFAGSTYFQIWKHCILLIFFVYSLTWSRKHHLKQPILMTNMIQKLVDVLIWNLYHSCAENLT